MRLKKIISVVTLLACAAPLLQADAAADESANKAWQFDVLLNGKPIGYHTFSLESDGDRRVLESEASFDVKFLFINAFSYRHEATEVWNDNCLLSIDAMTDSNGKVQSVRGQTADQGFQLQQPTDNELPACVKSFAYWNPAVLDAERLLNSQTGQYEDVTVTFEQNETVSVAGEPVDTERYRLATRGGDITLWYTTDTQTWVGLEAPAKGDRTLSYRPTGVPLPSERPELLAQGD